MGTSVGHCVATIAGALFVGCFAAHAAQVDEHQERILQKGHAALGRRLGLGSLDQVRDAVFGSEERSDLHSREADVQTDLAVGCAVSFEQCNNAIFSPPDGNKTYIYLDFLMKSRCDNGTCGCAQNTAISCNQSCYDTHTVPYELDACLSTNCSVMRQRPEGTQISEVTLYDANMQPLSIASATGVGSSPPGEGPEAAVDGKTSTKWFDTTLNADLDITLSQPGVPQYMTITTANDRPERDPVYFSLRVWDAAAGDYQTMAVVDDRAYAANGTAGVVPLARDTQMEKLAVGVARNAYDEQQGIGACDKLLSEGKYTCQATFCTLCSYPHYCDKSCGFQSAAMLVGPTTKYRFAVMGLRNPGRCEGESLDPNVWWTPEQERVRDTCGVPYLAINDWHCYSNQAGRVNCTKSGDACIISSVQTQFDPRDEVYVDTFDVAPCSYIETCDDSSRCVALAYEEYLLTFPESVTAWGHKACNQMFNCFSGRVHDYLSNCSKSHVTIDRKGNTCSQEKICEHISHLNESLPKGKVDCALERAEFINTKQEYFPKIQDTCATDSCAHLGIGSPGRCYNWDCCMENATTGALESVAKVASQRDNPAAPGSKINTLKYLTCEQMEYHLSFMWVCPYTIGPSLFHSDAQCVDYSNSLVWSGRENLLVDCLGYKLQYEDINGKMCNQTRICDVANTYYPRCDTKPFGLQTCSSPHFNTYPLVNMTADASGVCRCPTPYACHQESGYCDMPDSIVPTGVPGETLAPTFVPTAVPTAAPATFAPLANTNSPGTPLPVQLTAAPMMPSMAPFTWAPLNWTFGPTSIPTAPTVGPATAVPPTVTTAPVVPSTATPVTAAPAAVTTVPVASPTLTPVVLPTTTPSVLPTTTPVTAAPAAVTAVPVASPTLTPVVLPTTTPSVLPTTTPVTAAPAAVTAVPVASPTLTPVVLPTTTPSVLPTTTPVTAAPATMPPGVPSTTTPATAAPATMTPGVPPTAAPATTAPATMAPGVPPTTAPATTAPATMAPGVPPTAAPATTAPATMAPGVPPTAAPATTAPATMPPGVPPTTAPATTAPATMTPGVPPTTAPATTAPATMPPGVPPTTAPATTAPATMPPGVPPTTAPATASPATMPPGVPPTTAPATTAPATMPPGVPPTTAPATTAPATTAPATTPPGVPPTAVPATLEPEASPDTNTTDDSEDGSRGAAGPPGMMSFCDFRGDTPPQVTTNRPTG